MGLDWHRIAPDKSTGGANLDGNSLECFSPRDFHHVSWLRMSRVGFEEDLYIDRNPKDAGYLGGCLEDAVEQYYEERRNWLTEWLDYKQGGTELKRRQTIKNAEAAIMETLESVTRRGRTQTSIVDAGYMGKALRNLIKRGRVVVVAEGREAHSGDGYNTVTVSLAATNNTNQRPLVSAKGQLSDSDWFEAERKCAALNGGAFRRT